MFKKFISVFLCFVTVFTFTATALVSDGGITAEAASYSLPYYYYQLSDEAQDFYVCLRQAIIDYKSKIKLEINFDDDEIDKVAELLVFHDPLTFNVDDVTYRKTSKTAAVFTPEYRYSKETYDKMVKEYNKKAKTILGKLTDDMSTYKKIKTIHDYIIKETVYDLDAKNNENIYGVLVKNKAKCDGYAKTFTYICGKAGIRTVTVPGISLQTDDKENGHMWNKVYYNKKWYNVDVTWDDPTTNMKNNLQYDYFMVSDKDLSKTHKEEPMGFKIPKASDSSKNYFKVYKKYAGDGDDAVAFFKSELKSAAKAEKNKVMIKCSSKAALEKVDDFLSDDGVFDYLRQVQKSSNKDLVDAYFIYYVDSNMMTVTVNIFYKNTELDDYFNDTSKVSSKAAATLKRYGIS